jgi:hypothetical protein
MMVGIFSHIIIIIVGGCIGYQVGWSKGYGEGCRDERRRWKNDFISGKLYYAMTGQVWPGRDEATETLKFATEVKIGTNEKFSKV